MSGRRITPTSIKSRPPLAPDLHLGPVTTRSATLEWSYPSDQSIPHEPIPSKDAIIFKLETRLASTSVSESVVHYQGQDMTCTAEGLFPQEGYIARLITEWVDPPQNAQPSIVQLEFRTSDESELHRASAQLQRAVAENDSSKASMLLDRHGKELSLETRDKYGRTLLMSACQNGGPELVSALVEHGADVEAKTASGKTPLISSRFSRHNTTNDRM
ncbi:hypothetical protein SeLEV6574_g07153 [Synchytrium endobioticum]|uniref:Fibronectin type-III domain-containing protein n=1 Tax=Synchytrium endobioticum TaxID=286115 RepID=A0A507CIU6_9FUNG|nr:hypothetical protein SeLEV6574_g07153 [Synchytrium endobioticum]